MDIPALFASFSDGALHSHEAWFRGTRPVVRGTSVPFGEAVAGLPRGEDRGTVAVIDLDSLSLCRFTEGVVKNMRVRGHDIWLMTWIEDADDLFDAFNTNADMVLGPYHATESDHELSDILSVSDSFVPTVFAVGGRSVLRMGGRAEVAETLSRLADLGFYRTCVVDTDGCLDNAWTDLREDFPSMVPFTRSLGSTAAISGSRIGCLWPPRYS